MSGGRILTSSNTYRVVDYPQCKAGLQPQLRPSTPRYAPQVLARVACSPVASATHGNKTLQMLVGCEIPQWGEPRLSVCAAKPLAITFETSSPAFLSPQCTIEFPYHKPRIKTQCSSNLCACLLLCQAVLYSLRSPSTSAKNGMS